MKEVAFDDIEEFRGEVGHFSVEDADAGEEGVIGDDGGDGCEQTGSCCQQGVADGGCNGCNAGIALLCNFIECGQNAHDSTEEAHKGCRSPHRPQEREAGLQPCYFSHRGALQGALNVFNTFKALLGLAGFLFGQLKHFLIAGLKDFGQGGVLLFGQRVIDGVKLCSPPKYLKKLCGVPFS